MKYSNTDLIVIDLQLAKIIQISLYLADNIVYVCVLIDLELTEICLSHFLSYNFL